jgi:nitroimidazol reductase NimA-like FMN-containing flavoprotein (pyridoxamine 5'-phosphate oxidase superfamily)
MLYGRVGDRLYIHGARTSRLIRLLAAGTPACVTVTVLDALILARSAFEHSANYDSAALHGAFELVTGTTERLAALEAFTEAVVPGRWREVRAPNGKELRATAILAMPIDQAAVKTRTGPRDDDDSPDADLDIWAGVIPVTNLYGPAQPSPGLRAGVPLSDSVRRLVEGGR